MLGVAGCVLVRLFPCNSKRKMRNLKFFFRKKLVTQLRLKQYSGDSTLTQLNSGFGISLSTVLYLVYCSVIENKKICKEA